MYLVLNSQLLDVYMQCVYNKLCYFYLVSGYCSFIDSSFTFTY